MIQPAVFYCKTTDYFEFIRLHFQSRDKSVLMLLLAGGTKNTWSGLREQHVLV